MEKPIIPQNLLNKLNEDANFQAFIQNAQNREQTDLSAEQKQLLVDITLQLDQLHHYLYKKEE
jgi:hypothetical protein